MMRLPFIKMHGLGNSYIYIDGFKTQLREDMLSPLARKVSDQNFGIGSDGLIIMLPSEKADVRMRIFNKDGSEAMNCGNGLRCVAKLAFDEGYVKKRQFSIEAKSGVVQAEVHLNNDDFVEEVTVNMGPPILKRKEIPMITTDGHPDDHVVNETFVVNDNKYYITAVSMGNPHVIFFVKDIKEAPVETLGSIVTNDPRFPEGVNVEFVEVIRYNEINFRVWERGSGVTQACGTGASAAVVAGVLNDFVARNEEIIVHLDGGDLTIKWSNDDVLMRGPAEKVVQGTYFLSE
ncbi:diaminopimelate epimerase [Bacillaceae bacterium W0354]